MKGIGVRGLKRIFWVWPNLMVLFKNEWDIFDMENSQGGGIIGTIPAVVKKSKNEKLK